MPIIPSDIELRLSGGASNADTDASLGGVKSSVALTSGVLNNLFDQVAAQEANDGDVEYRCVYAHNDHSSLTLQSATVELTQNTPAGDTDVAVAVGTSAVNGVEQTIGDEDTAPAGLTFTDGTTPLALGDIPAGEHRAIWFRWTVNAAAAAVALDNFIARVQGATAA